MPGSVEALIKQADEFVQDGQAEEAIAIIQRIQARYPRQLIKDSTAARSGFSRYHPVSGEGSCGLPASHGVSLRD